MTGVGWSDKRPGDWLASNGRWYPGSTYPNGWSTTALPPAPGHGDAVSILRRFQTVAAGAIDRFDGDGDTPVSEPAASTPRSAPAPRQPAAPTSPPSPAASPSRAASPSARRSGSTGSTAPARTPRGPRGPAAATVVDQRPYAAKVPAGPPPPAALGRPAETNAPARVRSDAPPPPDSPSPPAPRSPAPAPPHTLQQGVENMAGDLGRVFGAARRKIEQAIEEAAEPPK